MSVDIEYLTRAFFYFDEPVNYKLNENNLIRINPISVRNSEIFLSSINILQIDKNSLPDVKIIQMSYLQFLLEKVLIDEINKQKFLNILILCLGINNPFIFLDEYKRPIIMDKERQIIINSKQFDDIKRIILYQNIVNYDDEYVNPELKENLDETMRLKNKNIEIPSLERKIAIITAHTGLTKEYQLNMTYRSHSLLFNEVFEETEYSTLYPLAVLGGNSDKADKWIYKQKRDKFENQVVSVSNFNKQAGGNGNVSQKITN